jgi:hypothetical protein
VKGEPLLGQSFLSKLPTWTIDNQRHTLVFNDVPGLVGAQQGAAVPSPQVTPPVQAPVSPAALASISNERSLQVVRAFYGALGKADGVSASRLVIPEKRLNGAFAPSEIAKFYSGLLAPLRVVQMNATASDAVEVDYQYMSPNRRDCRGRAVVTLVLRGDLLLIETIRATERC